MNGSSARLRTSLLLLLSVLMMSQVAAETCSNASTLVAGDLDSEAVVYDSSCNARTFQVVVSSTVERSLNLSNLDVVQVRSYPRVYQLLLNNNELETFAPSEADNDMEDLELAGNFVSDLTSFNFPRRLNYLDLSSNSISTLSSSTPWPESGELQTLLLHGNSLDSVGVDTFTKLVALQSLSLSSTGISNLDDLMLPVSLRTLNATKNSFTSASTNFSTLPTALQYLDLSSNLLTTFPTVVSSLTTLVELNLESNGIKKVSGVTFASTLRKVYLADNPLSTIEICRSDVSVFQSLAEFTAPSSVSSTCSNSLATAEEIKGVSFCVLDDDDCVISSITGSESGSLVQANINDISSSSDAASSEASTSSESSSIFSAESIGIIGSTFFLVGILLRSSGGNFMVFTASGRISRANGNDEYRDTDSKNDNGSTFADSGGNTPGEAAWGIYESPLDKYNPVALLEPSPKDKSFLGASTASLQARSKLKLKIDLDDLLVYEIPPEEIQMRRALHMSSSKKNSKAALGFSSVGLGSAQKKVDHALFLAEYQGYKVAIQALMRSKKRLEKRFVEQIRLAASLDHASIVHFIGVTTGCSTTASRRRGSSAASPQPPNGPTNSMGDSLARSTTKSRYTNMGAPSWNLGVVFEYMQHGSLATMFEAERHRREGKGFYPNSSIAAAIGSGNGNIFSWYPVFANSSASVNANPNADWRCKLSIALDVAMGLVYLHANNYAHGRVCARKVLVNEQGEAKLSAMDIMLPTEFVPSKDDDAHRMTDDFRGSLRDSALWTMQKIAGLRPTRHLGRSRFENNSGESDVSGTGDNPAFDEESDEFDENSLKSSGIGSATVAAQRDDVYAFGTFLWELDTMIAVEEDLASSRIPASAGGNPHLLKFSTDCPLELQELARQCWSEVPSQRPDAIDVQEELVRVLEGRLTTSGPMPANWARPSYLSSSSALSSLSSSELSSNMSSLPSSCSVMAVSVADLLELTTSVAGHPRAPITIFQTLLRSVEAPKASHTSRGMRRGAPTPHDSAAPRPTYKTPTSGATTPRSQRSAATTPRSQRSGSAATGTVLVNLDVLIHRANIGRDISPNDEDLIVLFRRNSKEVTSEPARWSADHCAAWNQHLGIQTSLLRHKKPQSGATNDFLKKEYEIVLVALPSHSAVALFSLDFATLVHLNASPQERHKSFRISPLKCRDLAATLEFDITWDLVHATGNAQTTQPAASMLLHPTSNPHAPTLAGLPPSSTLLGKSSHAAKAQTPKSRRATNDTSSVSTRRTTTSMSSQGSERELLEELSASNCTNCRSAKRRLDRKEVQVLQLESFLKESQKRIDAVATENEELVLREKAETRNAAQQRALSLRLLQELETAVQLCNNQMQVQDTTLLPQVELIERVKKFHEEGSSSSAFDFRAETEAALQRNQRLQQQLEFLGRSMDYDSENVEDSSRRNRAATDTSGTTISSARSGSVTVDCEARPVALTMTQQLNNLERENFKLRAELEGALANAASALKKHSGGFPSGLTTGFSLTAENESAIHEDKEPARAPGFLDKIYADVGKAKLVLEDRVKQLDDMLASTTEENARLRNEIEDLQKQKGDSQQQASTAEMDEHIAELERLLEAREAELRSNETELAQTKMQLQSAEARARAGERAKAELENELAGVRLTLKMAQEETTQLENHAAPATTSSSFVSHYSAASDAAGHNEELADVQKKLKLSKQEVMQLRFRSNQLESVHERLEDALKEKRTLEVKLTALEGQLFEQRSRTINSDNSSFTAPSLDAKSSAMLTDMQRELDQKSAQLMMAEHELKNLRESSSSGNIEDVADKVKRFENEIVRLCQRNDEQAKRLEKLGDRQMVTEMSLLGKDVKLPAGARNHRTPSIPETDEMDKSPLSMLRRVSPPAPAQTSKITDRYASAVASSASHTPNGSTPGVTSNKVAQLMKNFSSQNSDDDSVGGSPSGVAFKRPTKLDFRNRKASASSQRSNDDTTPTPRLRRTPSNGPQLF
uniref:Protein kinase domain-containing protein n=1 Tax=Phytophthora ramorum TaxID=164328 RepID=H3HB26_PHYRM